MKLAALALAALLSVSGAAGMPAAANPVIPAEVTTALADNLDYRPLANIANQTWQNNLETRISLRNNATAVTGAATNGVRVSGNTISITAPGIYRISGTLANGQLVVNSNRAGLVRLILDNANVTSRNGSALAITNAETVALVIASGSTNSLVDAQTYAVTGSGAPNSTLDSTADLVISGTGRLNITGNANRGINARAGLVINGPRLQVTAADDAIRGQNYVVIVGGNLNLTAADDGIVSNADLAADGAPTQGYVAILNGNITISAADDAITAETEVIVANGQLDITRSYEGIEGSNILIAGGVIDIKSEDDGINAAHDVLRRLGITISGGTITIDAEGDGLDANGVLQQTGGSVVIHGSTSNRQSSMDANRPIMLDGGTLFALGSAGMIDNPSADSAQDWLIFVLDRTVPAGSQLEIRDPNGRRVAALTSEKGATAVTYSAPRLPRSGTYTLTANRQVVGSATLNQPVQRRR